jgi:hypothetical protein
MEDISKEILSVTAFLTQLSIMIIALSGTEMLACCDALSHQKLAGGVQALLPAFLT